MSLERVKQIAVSGAMNAPQTRRLMSILNGDTTGDTPRALFVGGCVRNILMGKMVADIDIATVLSPHDVMEVLEQHDVHVIPTGVEHGTVTAVIDKIPFEITTLRHDVETDGRHAVVAFTDSWIEDARRRDFTMNTLLMDIAGQVYDPLGQGVADVERAYVRFVGVPSQRIHEDALRILRFFRFSVLYGGGHYDVQALDACAAAANMIGALSRERVTQEYTKILMADHAADCLGVMSAHAVLGEIMPWAYGVEDAAVLARLCEGQLRYDALSLPARLVVLTREDTARLEAMARRVLFPKAVLKAVQAIGDVVTRYDLSCDSVVRGAVYRFGGAYVVQAALIALAQKRITASHMEATLAIAQSWAVPRLPITGHDVMAAGVAKGARLGQVLREVETWWIAQDFVPDRDDLLRQVEVLGLRD